jgi:hypothetical protein
VTTLKTAAADAPAIRTARSRRLMAGSCGCLDDREPVPFQHRPDERTETVIVVHDEDLRTGCHRLSVTPCLAYRIRAGPDPEQGQPADRSQAHPDVRQAVSRPASLLTERPKPWRAYQEGTQMKGSRSYPVSYLMAATLVASATVTPPRHRPCAQGAGGRHRAVHRRDPAGESVIDPQVVSRLVARPRRDSPLDTLTERELAVLALMAEGRSTTRSRVSRFGELRGEPRLNLAGRGAGLETIQKTRLMSDAEIASSTNSSR